jgi:hypothetical protein
MRTLYLCTEFAGFGIAITMLLNMARQIHGMTQALIEHNQPSRESQDSVADSAKDIEPSKVA